MSSDDDPITTASAGLRALGVAPQRRIETLGLLAALIDLADDDGAVELDAALMRTEERLGIDACLEGYEWLERLDVIRRTWAGWEIQHFAAHTGPVGMTEASLAVLQRHLASGDDEPVHEPALPLRDAVVPVRRWRRRVPVIAASVAAGVALLGGATQLVPQAAVTTRDVASRSAHATADAPGTAASVAPTLPAGVATTHQTAGAPSGADAATTTTSTTVLPPMPCLGDVLRDLGTKAGLRTTQTTQNAPGVLPCP